MHGNKFYQGFRARSRRRGKFALYSYNIKNKILRCADSYHLENSHSDQCIRLHMRIITLFGHTYLRLTRKLRIPSHICDSLFQIYIDSCIYALVAREEHLRDLDPLCFCRERKPKRRRSLPTYRDQKRKRARTLSTVEERFATGGTSMCASDSNF